MSKDKNLSQADSDQKPSQETREVKHAANPFKEAVTDDKAEHSPQEDAELEQERKETLTERD